MYWQLAKLGGNKVVATCGGQQKAALLKSLGVDRVIDYKTESIKDVRYVISGFDLSFPLQFVSYNITKTSHLPILYTIEL